MKSDAQRFENISMKVHFFIICILSSACLAHSQHARPKRPFYVIGHMANSIKDAAYFMERGANALEFDVQFYTNGSVAEVYHGPPCDCFRICTHRAPLPEYLKYMRQATDPLTGNYSNQMVFVFFDLKLGNVKTDRLYTAGSDIARHVLDYLWESNTGSKFLRALIFISSTRDEEVVSGFVDTFRACKKEHLLANVGFDGGLDNLSSIRQMFEKLGIQGNIWIGDGTLNCLSPTYPDNRLKDAVEIRDSNNSFIDKVYHWTIDEPFRMRLSLRLGVDGMITNVPDVLNNVVNEVQYQPSYRVATADDNPFTRFSPLE